MDQRSNQAPRDFLPVEALQKVWAQDCDIALSLLTIYRTQQGLVDPLFRGYGAASRAGM